MKTIKHYLVFVIFLPLTALGQTIVNGNFESWTTIPVDTMAGLTPTTRAFRKPGKRIVLNRQVHILAAIPLNYKQ